MTAAGLEIMDVSGTYSHESILSTLRNDTTRRRKSFFKITFVRDLIHNSMNMLTTTAHWYHDLKLHNDNHV
jgi:hypothetical protein